MDSNTSEVDHAYLGPVLEPLGRVVCELVY